MLNRKVTKVFCLIAFFFCSSAFAQTFTGTIEGTIHDNDDRPVPGAILTASSPSLIGGKAMIQSGQDGFYRFPFLPSGTYDVEVALTGFQSQVRKAIDLSIGVTLTVDFTLQIAAVAEVVEVTENPPLIDVTSPAISVTIPSEIIHNLPETKSIKNLLALTPGVDDDLNAYGADGAKANTVSIDGVTMSDSRAASPFEYLNPHASKLLTIGYNYNWIENVQVAGIGAPAEFGGFTGVAASFTTRSGGNQYHGLFETFFQNENLTSTNVPDPAPQVPFNTYDMSGQLGGPILHDKLWFFMGLQVVHNEIQPFGFDGVMTDAQAKVITKLTYKVNQENTLQGFLNRNNGSIENNGAGLGVLPEAVYTSRNPQWSGNADWISLLGPQTNLELRYGGLHDKYFDDEDRPDVSGHYDGATGITSGNNLITFSLERVRHQVNTVLSHHADDFMKGNHDFRFGVEFEWSQSEESYDFNGGAWYYDYYGAPALRYIAYNAGLDGSNHRFSAYVQDEWKVSDQITLSLGVRWDRNRGITDRRVVFATDPVAPRLGLVWLLSRDTQTVIKASYGDYYEALLEADYHFLSDEIRFARVDAFDPSSGEWVEDFHNSARTLSGNHLRHPFVRQFSIGIDRALPGKIPLSVHYIYRKFGNILEDVGTGPFVPVPFVNPLDGKIITVYDRAGPEETLILQNPPGLYRRYDGIEIFASKQIARRFSLSSSFVYSRLRGNFPGNSAGPGSVNSGFLNTPNSLINFPGRLKDDPTFTYKIFGTIGLPLGFDVGIFFRHASGDTWTATGNANDLKYVRFTSVFLEPVGSRRLPSENLLDMRLEKEFPVYSGQLRFTVDVFNVFNKAYARRLQRTFGRPNFGMPQDYNAPREMRLGIRYTF